MKTTSILQYFSAICTIYITFVTGSLLSHEKHHLPSENDSPADYAEIHSGDTVLRMKMIPESPFRSISGRNSVMSFSEENLRDDGKSPEVGRLTYITAALLKNGSKIPADFNLKIIQTEKEKEILNISLKSRNGEFFWGHQFYDGGPYRIEIRALDLTNVTSLNTSLSAQVAGIEPPLLSTVKSLLLLLLITAAGIPAGYYFSKIISRIT